ncbi:MAG: VIT1/CCC1 transporter family protein [Chthonomonadales bacterium]
MEKQDVVKRLLDAWRGEIRAGLVYRTLAERETDERRAAIIRQMAEVEAVHRRRIEERLAQLGVALPDPATVRISPWFRLQMRFAPAERILAMQEAAETDEVDDQYLRPTGDEDTDRLLAEIRRDEQNHKVNVRALRQDELHHTPEAPQAAALDRILSQETWHKRGAGWVSGAIYGANDGLAAVFGIVSGVSGATSGQENFVLTAGLAGALASALSMATGAYLAEKSQTEVAEANIARERHEVETHPEEEKEELSLFYQLKGLTKDEADRLAEELARHPDVFLKVLATEEFEGQQEGGNPVQSALAAGISTGLGAMIPVIPFFWMHGTPGVIVAALVSLVAHFAVGAAKSLFTLRSWWAAGWEMTLAGIIVGAVTYTAGALFHVG